VRLTTFNNYRYLGSSLYIKDDDFKKSRIECTCTPPRKSW